MNKQKKKQPADWREARRLQAWKLAEKGWKQKTIAQALGVSAGAVSQWLKKARRDGVESLRHRKGGGPKAHLKAEQIEGLPNLLNQGAAAHGFRGDVWTRGRVGTLIKRHFGVQFSLSHVGRLLQQMGWSRQQPIERASQRDEAAIERWRTEKWPELEKKRLLKDER